MTDPSPWITASPVYAAVLMAGVLAALAGAALALRARVAEHAEAGGNELIDAVDALLPQTQCAQCGYPGCRPYAEALASGSAASNLCPPGGAEVADALNELLGTRSGAQPAATHTGIAVIDETRCIGCTLCLPPCPVDAIVGAQGQMHTVIAAECTGCELCVPACPVDCIEMVETQPAQARPRRRRPPAPSRPALGCVRCGLCDPVCPVDLPVMALFDASRMSNRAESRALGVTDCIECGRCDAVCPSALPLADTFGRIALEARAQDNAAASQAALKARYERHSRRLAETARTAESKRAARIAGGRRWQ